MTPRPTPTPASPRQGGNRTATHTQLLNAIEEYLQVRGAWTFRVRGGLGQRRGMPDLLAAFPLTVGKDHPYAAYPTLGFYCDVHAALVCVEVKTGKAVLSQAQEVERARLMEVGALYIEARDVETVEDALVAAGLVQTPAIWPRREGQPQIPERSEGR